MYNTLKIVLLLLLLNTGVSTPSCERGLYNIKGEYVIITCPSTKKDCAEWLSVEKAVHGYNTYTPLGIIVFPDVKNIIEPSDIQSFDMDKVVLKRVSKNDIYHISIGIKSGCSKVAILESIIIDAHTTRYIDTEHNDEYNKNTTNITPIIFSRTYNLYVLIIIPTSIVLIAITVIYVIYRQRRKRNVGTIVDNDNFILINLPSEKAPLFTLVEDQNHCSDEE